MKRQNFLVSFTAIITVVLLVFSVKVVYADHMKQVEWEESRETIVITVKSGDTVDGYWAKYAPDWMGREQYREEFKQLNRTNSCGLDVGDKVKLYVEGGN